MKRKYLCLILGLIFALTAVPLSFCEALYTDESFQGDISTETLDAIIEKYELYNGWYWTTEAGVIQDFHGHEGKPGWTDTAVNVRRQKDYEKGWYGYRWGKTEINPREPNDEGYGECFGFTQFIGYLLSGERNPARNWFSYDSVRQAGGLKPGDIIRAEYQHGEAKIRHSAVVYSVDEEKDEVRFIQVSGRQFNLIRTREGYTDGYLVNETSIREIRKIPEIRIYRYIPKK